MTDLRIVTSEGTDLFIEEPTDRSGQRRSHPDSERAEPGLGRHRHEDPIRRDGPDHRCASSDHGVPA